MASIPEIILNNPFRVLGVYANSTHREIVASISKATKFMEVGREVDYPLDLSQVKSLRLKSEVSHSLEDLNNASALLSNSEERLKYAQFWFLKMTPLDEEAFKFLFEGNINQALTIWKSEDNLSSLQNRMMLYFFKGDAKYALQNGEKLYELFGDDFLKAVDSNGTLVKNAEDLIHDFIDTLVAYLKPGKLLESIKSPVWIEYLNQTLSDTTIAKVNEALQEAKDQLELLNNEGAASAPVFLSSGIGAKLLANTKDEYYVLKRVFQPDNPRFELISDSIAKMLYECSVDEYNKRKFSPNYSINLLQHALNMAQGSMAKEEIGQMLAQFKKIAYQSNGQSDGDDKSGCSSSMVRIILYAIFLLVVAYLKAKGCH